MAPPQKSPLRIGLRLEKNLYTQQGLMIARAGQVLEQHHLTLLKSSGATELIQGTPKRKERDHRKSLKTVTLNDIPVDEALRADIYDQNGTILLRKGDVMTRMDQDALLRRGMNEIWADESAVDSGAMPRKVSTKQSILELFERQVIDPRSMKIRARGTPVKLRVNRRIRRSESEKQEGFDLIDDIRHACRKLMDELKHGRITDIDPLSYQIQRGIDMICSDLNYFAYLIACHDHGMGDWRAAHLAHTFLTSIAIGIYRDFDEDQLTDLGISALLHDVGMIRIRPEVLEKPGPLSKHEFLEVQAHPMHSVSIAEKVEGLSKHVLLSIYQSHERMGGQGYPMRRNGDQIHDFAKVVAVADTFCALRASRPHRPSLDAYPAVERIVRLASNKRLCPISVKALLQTIGLYPIGSWVKLSTEKIARVVAMRHQAKGFDRPIVRMFYDEQQLPIEFPENIDLSSNQSIKIEQSIDGTRYELDELQGF